MRVHSERWLFKANDRGKKEWQVDSTTGWQHNAIFISIVNKTCMRHWLIV